jgi:riboflavin synthase
MFNGIIEGTAIVTDIQVIGTNNIFWLTSPFIQELYIDQSIAHNGACLTVDDINGNQYRVTAIKETLLKTNLGDWMKGSSVNIERSILPTQRIDGHFVQGHVDCTGICTEVKDENGSWNFRFEYEEYQNGFFTVSKGSICVNGVSLTVVESGNGFFTVSIIPYTYKHTNFNQLCKGMKVNIEFDILGKYIQRLYQRQVIR